MYKLALLLLVTTALAVDEHNSTESSTPESKTTENNTNNYPLVEKEKKIIVKLEEKSEEKKSSENRRLLNSFNRNRYLQNPYHLYKPIPENPLEKFLVEAQLSNQDQRDPRPNRIDNPYLLNQGSNRHQNNYYQQTQNVYDQQYSQKSTHNHNHRYKNRISNRQDYIVMEEEQKNLLQNHPYFGAALRSKPMGDTVPNYIEALKNYDAVEDELNKHLVWDKDAGAEIHYLTILSVIDILTRYASKCLEPHDYHDNYYERANKAILEAISFPQGVSRRIKFKMDDVDANIIQIRDVISSPYVQASCANVSITQCNTVILAVLQASGNKMLQSQGDLVIHLGDNSKLFLDVYLKEFKSVAQAKHEVEYVLAAVHRLKPLIDRIAKTHGLIHPESSCENRSRLPID